MSSAQINIRTSSDLLAELDEVVEVGRFRNRTEAVNEALRLLIRRYKVMKVAERIEKMAEDSEEGAGLTRMLMESREEDDG